MSGLHTNLCLVKRLEQRPDARFPERSEIATRVLGYAEMGTVLEIGMGAERDMAYNRMPQFRTEQERTVTRHWTENTSKCSRSASACRSLLAKRFGWQMRRRAGLWSTLVRRSSFLFSDR
jgi:hypothetical protein